MLEPLRVTLYSTPYHSYTSMLVAGLMELRARDYLTLDFSSASIPSPSDEWRPAASIMMRLEHDRLRKRRVLCFDLDDGPHMHPEHLAACDVYFKRGYQQQRVSSLATQQSAKIKPFGLQYACRSPHETAKDIYTWHRALEPAFIPQRSTIRKVLYASFKAVQSGLRDLQLIEDTRPLKISAFESDSKQSVVHKVFFRTRVYAPEDAPGAHKQGKLAQINRMRVETVRALQEHLGDRFVGGLRRSRYALEKYPECVLKDDSGFLGHIKSTRKYLVNVNTEGLHGSTGWKLAEAIASASCIVSEAPKYTLPSPLNEGIHYLPFQTPLECVERCKQLLGNPALAHRMRLENQKYYQLFLRPDEVMRRCLDIAVQEHRTLSA